MAASRPEKRQPPVVALKSASLGFGGRPLFEGIDLGVAPGERICLVGRNGSGKSTLLKALAGEIDLDGGERFVQPGVRIAYLPQDPAMPAGQTVFDYVNAGLPPADDGVPRAHVVDATIVAVGADGERRVETLSGGEARRAALARALVSDPTILLLDEPTNHLDLPTIEWLESELMRASTGLLMISHDRTFLRHLANRMCWLERGQLHRTVGSIDDFPDWADKLLADEEVQAHKLNRKIAEETRWLREGLTARRKRNMGRVRNLLGLRRERADRIKRPEGLKLDTGDASKSGTLVLEAIGLSKTYEDEEGRQKVVADNVSFLLRRGDRVGVIGRNGVGKTTLLRMLLGEEAPDTGRVKEGFGIQSVYFDQRRAQLNPEDSLWSTLCPLGGDTVEVQGKPKHVVSYLRDYLFDDRQATAKVSTLSGGERNRLLLAKLFTQPHNLLILDEPTNDLDVETLDLLQEEISDYGGTVLLVSHDRDFLDRTVTSILEVSEGGKVREFVGGYSDYLAERKRTDAHAEDRTKSAPKAKDKPQRIKSSQTKLSYKDGRELEMLPDRIAGLEGQIEKLQGRLGDADLYAKDPEKFAKLSAELEAATAELTAAEDRWLELEALKEELEGA